MKGLDDAIVEIGDDDRVLAASIRHEIDYLSSSHGVTCCIYRVHEKLRKINELAYTPTVVAIGPYHHHKQHLQAMEKYKLRCVEAILARTDTPDIKLQSCVAGVRTLEESARKCYSDPINIPDRDEFVKMMVVDGLFIIGILCEHLSYLKEDVIFEIHWMMESIAHDLILLENQLPMFVLSTLFDQLYGQRCNSPTEHPLTKFALRFFHCLLPGEENSPIGYPISESKHLLDLLSNSLNVSYVLDQLNNSFGPSMHSSPILQSTGSNALQKFLPCVTQLHQAGVKFKKGKAGCFLNIKFENGILEIPPLKIEDSTDLFFRNLIAFEQYSYGRDSCITSYTFLMDCLINSADDVGLLRRCGIITSFLGNDEAVSSLFNMLGNEINISDFYYSELCEKLVKHYNTRWPRWKQKLKRNYLSSPWEVLSIVIGTLFLFFTFLGSLFAILSFSVHNS